MNSKEVLQSIRVALGFEAERSKFESALLKDGTQIVWEGELSVGTPIMVVTAEGEIPAPDATHELEDGTLVTTQSGAVTEIVNPTLVEEPMEDVSEVVEEVVSDSAVVEEVAAIVDQITPDAVTPEVATEVAVEVISQIVDIIDEAPEAEAVVEMMRKIKKMRKMKYTKLANDRKETTDKLQKDVDALKEGIRKLVSVVEEFSAIPSHEPIQKPHTPSKKASQEEQLMKFSHALNKIKK